MINNSDKYKNKLKQNTKLLSHIMLKSILFFKLYEMLQLLHFRQVQFCRALYMLAS